MFPIFPVDYPFIERGTLLSRTQTTKQEKCDLHFDSSLINTAALARWLAMGSRGETV